MFIDVQHRADAAPQSPANVFGTAPASLSERVRLHHLRTPAQIAQVLPLRQEIDLSAHAMGDEFLRLEKKETSWASSVPSSSTGS